MLELVFLYLLVCGVKKAWDDTKAAWGKSRKAYTKRAKDRYPSMPKSRRVAHAARHDAGYGLSQLLHGFPQSRHGFAQGWHEGRQAHIQARTEMERARAGHAEARRDGLSDIEALRQRRREALEEIRRQERGEGSGGSPGEVPVPDEPAGGGYCPYCATRDDEQCPPECATWTLRRHPYPGREGGPTYSYGPESATSGWPSATAEHAHGQAQYMSGDGNPWVVTEYPPGGGPGRTVATYRNGELQAEEEDPHGEPEGDGDRAVHYDVFSGGQPASGTNGTENPTEGTSMSDVTYDGVVRDMATAVSNAENRAAEVNAAMAAAEEQAQEAADAKTRASQTADEMQALNMDAATLGAMADHLEALDGAEKAHQHVEEALEAARKEAVRVMETAQNVTDTLQRGHQGLAEAHQNAPVEAAERPFYQD